MIEATSSALCFHALSFSLMWGRQTLFYGSCEWWADHCEATAVILQVWSSYVCVHIVRFRFSSHVRLSSKESFSHSFSQSVFPFQIVGFLPSSADNSHNIFTYVLENIFHYYALFICKGFFIVHTIWLNLLKPTGHVMHQQFNIQQLYALPTLYLCVLCLSENKQRFVPLTA